MKSRGHFCLICRPLFGCHMLPFGGLSLIYLFRHATIIKFHALEGMLPPFFCLLILFYFYLFLIYIYINSLAEIDLPYFTTEITTSSSPFALSLAKHLHSVGAKMYGAFWCSHCLEQKQVHLPPFICFCSFLKSS